MFEFANNALIYTLPFLVVLTLVITVHEFGHFIVARWCGVSVDRFSIGFGRSILSWTDKHGTEWRVGWIPLGGYVRFAGQESVASVPDHEEIADLRKEVLAKEGPEALKRYFDFKPLWQRALVVAAGPVANFILAIGVFAAFAMAIGEISTTPQIGRVLPNSPAAAAGFQAGDVVKRAGGGRIDDFETLSAFVKQHADETMPIVVLRNGQTVVLTATPQRRSIDTGMRGQKLMAGYLGLEPSGPSQRVRYGPIGALRHGVKQTAEVIGATLNYLKRIAVGRESGDQFSGPLGIAGFTGQAASEATRAAPDLGTGATILVLTLVRVAAFISVAVGFANLLPIPVLDGGHLLFYAYEAVARRPLAANVQAAGYRVGFALLIGLMLFVTWNDLQRYRVFHLIGGLFS